MPELGIFSEPLLAASYAPMVVDGVMLYPKSNQLVDRTKIAAAYTDCVFRSIVITDSARI